MKSKKNVNKENLNRGFILIGEKITKGEITKKDCTVLCDRIRQIAILLQIMALQNESSKSISKKRWTEKVELIEKTINDVNLCYMMMI